MGQLRAMSSDASNGAFIVREDSLQAYAYVHHVLADGRMDPAWSALGVELDHDPDDIRVAPDGHGGAYVVGRQGLGGGAYIMPAWHILANGTLSATTPPSGKLLIPTSQRPTAIDIMADGAGGVFVAWDTLRALNAGSDLILQRYSGDFSVHAGWPSTGMNLNHGPTHNFNPRIVPAPNGDILVAFDCFASDGGTLITRVSPDGSFPVPALAHGAQLANASGDFAVVADGTGGAFCSYSGDNPDPRSNPVMQYLRGDGTRPPGWPANGLRLAVGTWFKLDFFNITSDGIGGAFMSWTDERNYATNIADSYLQHVKPDASLYPGWPQGGLDIGPNPGCYDLGAVLHGDGHGGVWALYESDSFIDGSDRMYASHLGSDGVPLPGWQPGGIDIAPNGLSHDDSYPTFIVDDGRGGIIAAWESGQFGGGTWPVVFVQRFVDNSTVATDFSLISTQAAPDQVELDWQTSLAAGARFTIQRSSTVGVWDDVATVDSDGQSRVRFTDSHVLAGARYGYRLRNGEGPNARYSLDTWVDVPAAYHFALAGARPNPATGSNLSVSFSLERSLPAALEVFDVSGRRVALRDVGALGGGEHVLPLGRDLRLAQGLYWLRLTQGAHRATSRVVVTE